MKRMLLVTSVLLLGATFSMAAMTKMGYFKVKFTVTAIDEKGVVMPGVTVGGDLYAPRDNRPPELRYIKEVTDRKGKAVVSESNLDDEQQFILNKEGYYQSRGGFKFTGNEGDRWQPWNPSFIISMKKIRNPVAMYLFHRSTPIKVHEYDTKLGYDFAKGDWVAPHGNGEEIDIYLNMYRRFESANDHDVVLTLTFPNAGDGIQEISFDENDSSEYKWPFLAPETGYLSTYIFKHHRSKDKGTVDSYDTDKSHYLLRVRTTKDEDGKILSACYLRMSKVNVGWGDYFQWKYWFNPDPKSRSLEYDTKKNLFEE